jgi:peptidoglycan/LPS O-acetylase OafA/YrhL
MRQETRRILARELWRSVVWAGLALVSWGFLVGESTLIPRTLLTTLGLPFLTWVVVTCGAVGVCLLRTRGLRLRSRAGRTLCAILALAAGGFLVVFTVTFAGQSLLFVGPAYLAVTAGTALWLVSSDRSSRTVVSRQ